MTPREKNDPCKVTRTWVVLAMLGLSPLFIAFACFGDPATGRVAWLAGGMIVLAARMRYRSALRPWFWITLDIIVLLHVPLILFVPWSNRNIPGISLMPLCVLDFAFVYYAIKFVGAMIERTPLPRA